MSLRQFTNNANATLAAGISSGATSLSLTAGEGSLFPSLTGNQYFVATLIKSGTPTTFEIIKVTARSGDTFTTIARAQEGTTALSWNAGDTCALLFTTGDAQNFAQTDDLQAQATNYAADTGSANNYSVTLSPALSAHVVGLPIRFKAAHTNTSPTCTFNDGAGSATLAGTGFAANNLNIGSVVAGGIYDAVWDGTRFQLQTPTTIFSGPGSFTATCPDISGSPTCTVWYNIGFDGHIIVYTDSTIASITGTSITNALTLTGAPSGLIPTRLQQSNMVLTGAADAGSGTLATINVDTSGHIFFYKSSNNGVLLINWSPTGTKTAPAFVFTYSVL